MDNITNKIMEAIKNAEFNNQEIISINIPKNQEKELIIKIQQIIGDYKIGQVQISKIFGYPIKSGKKLSLTIKI